MKQTYTLKGKFHQFLHILLPIFVTQVSLFSMNFFDTVMSGQAGAQDLAGVAIGASLWGPIFTGLNGVLLALTPIIAQLVGAKQKGDVPFQVIQGIYLAIAISFSIIACGALLLGPLLDGMELEQAVRMIARDYLIALAWGIVPLFIYSSLRCFMDALGKTAMSMVITLLALPINIFLNYALIFGKAGFPRLGGVGAGYASAITYWFILLVSLLVVWRLKPFSAYPIFGRAQPVSLSAWKEQLKIGIPIGLSIFFETSIFAAVTLFMSGFNTETIAAHQAAINFASLLYMVPMSISMALTITVGFEVGAQRYHDAKIYSYLGLGNALILALISAVGLSFFQYEVASLYTKDPQVLELTRHFLVYAIFFQLSDAIAAPIQGALRGYKDVNATFWAALISYWVLGLPIGILLAKFTLLGPYGYWVGLILGLAFGAIFLSIRLLNIQRKGQLSIQ